ncbi:SDR family NAD(P)-dependent oxidoreductase [Streptomyces minutiscleroticus]|uniref:SDR family NAD(P)-dependent oxidoreductase n=1 Tax=Streptomyces minutiscleroticus TaxID=68238 RepID=UPI00332BE7D9
MQGSKSYRTERPSSPHLMPHRLCTSWRGEGLVTEFDKQQSFMHAVDFTTTPRDLRAVAIMKDFDMSKRDGTPRSALVTGGNSGIGLAVAQGLGQKGYKVWIAGRSAEKGAAAVARLRPHTPAGVEFLPLDVTLFADIEKFVSALRPQLGGRLDALVHSTGALNAKRVVSADGLEGSWATQFLGRYLLTEAFTPELASADDGRVVFVSAQPPKNPRLFEDDPSLEKNYTIMRAISQAQSASALYEQMYAAEHPDGPAINGANAGVVANTGIGRAQPALLRMTSKAMSAAFGISPEQSAKNIVALASDPALEGVSGYCFPKPQNLQKRRKLAYSEEHLASLRRVLAKYATTRSKLLSA